MAGAPVRETENLVTDGEPLDPGADLRHDAGEVTPLSGWECGWPDRVKHSLPDLGLTGVDRRGLDFHQYFSVNRLRDRHAGHSRCRIAFELIADAPQLVGQHATADGKLIAVPSAAKVAAGPRLVPLTLHGALVRVPIDREGMSRRGILDEIEGNAVRVVQLEGRIAGKHPGRASDHFCDLGL